LNEYLRTCSIGALKLIKGRDIRTVLPQTGTSLSIQSRVLVRLTCVPDRLA